MRSALPYCRARRALNRLCVQAKGVCPHFWASGLCDSEERPGGCSLLHPESDRLSATLLFPVRCRRWGAPLLPSRRSYPRSAA